MVYNVVEFGAVADGKTLCTKAVQKAFILDISRA